MYSIVSVMLSYFKLGMFNFKVNHAFTLKQKEGSNSELLSNENQEIWKPL